MKTATRLNDYYWGVFSKQTSVGIRVFTKIKVTVIIAIAIHRSKNNTSSFFHIKPVRVRSC